MGSHVGSITVDYLSKQWLIGKVDRLQIYLFYWCHNVSNGGDLHIRMYGHVLSTFLYLVFTFVLLLRMNSTDLRNLRMHGKYIIYIYNIMSALHSTIF